MIMQLHIDELRGDTLKEKLEALVVEILHLSGGWEGVSEARAGWAVANMFDCACAPMGIPHPLPEPPYKIKLNTFCDMFLDSDVDEGTVVFTLKDRTTHRIQIEGLAQRLKP